MSQQAMVSSKSKEESSVCSQTKVADSSVSSQPKEDDDSSVSSGQSKENDDSSASQSKGDDSSEVTPLERHVAFFDRNGDGLIYPWETYQGFRAIGAGRLLSALAALSINLGLSHQTRPGKGFSPLFPIEWKNSELALHGSDTGVYDKNGRFVESKFEEIFKKHAHTRQDALTYNEIKQLLKANRDPVDFIGWISAFGEWKILHQLFQDKDGLLQKEIVRGVYDGSLFEQIENKNGISSSSHNKND